MLSSREKITWYTCSLFNIFISLHFGGMYHQVLSVIFRYHEGFEKCLDNTVFIGDFLVPHCLGILLLVLGIAPNHLRKSPLKLTIPKLWSLIGRCCQAEKKLLDARTLSFIFSSLYVLVGCSGCITKVWESTEHFLKLHSCSEERGMYYKNIAGL